jgi:hypothetical protein
MRALFGKLTHPGTKREQHLLRLKRDLFREGQGTNSHEVPKTRFHIVCYSHRIRVAGRWRRHGEAGNT